MQQKAKALGGDLGQSLTAALRQIPAVPPVPVSAAALEAALTKVGYKRYLQKANFAKADFGLTDNEKVAVEAYVGPVHRPINAVLSGQLEQAGMREADVPLYQPLIVALDSALLKMPVYSGTVVRMTNLYRLEVSLLLNARVNSVVKIPLFMSSSYVGQTFSDRSVMLIIQSKNGRNIHALGQAHENEVLFPRNSLFVVDLVAEEGGKKVLYLTEL